MARGDEGRQRRFVRGKDEGNVKGKWVDNDDGGIGNEGEIGGLREPVRETRNENWGTQDTNQAKMRRKERQETIWGELRGSLIRN